MYGTNSRSGRLRLRELRHFVERQHAVDLEHAVVGGAERALHEALQLGRHVRFDVEADHRTAAPALERGLEQPHQIFGFFEDFQFGVADDPERADAFDRVAGKQLADEQAGGAFDRDQPDFAALAGLRQPHETLDPVGHADQRIHRLAVLGARKLQGDREAEIGNEREWMRRIDGKRRQQRKDVGEEIILQPGFLRLGDVRAVDQHDAGFGERSRAARAIALADLRPARTTASAMRTSCSAGVRPSGLLVAMPARTCARKTGDPHHEKFVEVVCRYRQEPQALEQRMTAVGGFFENAAIEIQPRQFAIDEAFRARGDSRTPHAALRVRPAERARSGDGSGLFEYDGGRLATISHGYILLLKPHPDHPRSYNSIDLPHQEISRRAAHLPVKPSRRSASSTRPAAREALAGSRA